MRHYALGISEGVHEKTQKIFSKFRVRLDERHRLERERCCEREAERLPDAAEVAVADLPVL